MRTDPVDISCQNCGKMRKMHAYRVKQGTGKYCNQACYLSHRWKRTDKCAECGEPCEHRYCSDACRRKFWDRTGYATYGRRDRNWQRRLEIIKTLGGKCVDCGFDDYRALDIDHIDPSKKLRAKNRYFPWSHRFKDWEANAKNIRLLCANCHRLHTWKQRKFGPTGLVCK